jgi:hypothetical protein
MSQRRFTLIFVKSALLVSASSASHYAITTRIHPQIAQSITDKIKLFLHL